MQDKTARSRIIQGKAPWFPGLAKVMEPAPDLLERIAAEFAPISGTLRTKGAYWYAFHMFLLEKMVGEAMAGPGLQKPRAQAWARAGAG